MWSSRDPSRIVPLPSPVSRPYDLLCFVLYGAQNQTLPETPPLAAPRITVVGSYATGLTMKVQRLPSTEADFRDVLSGWLFWAFAQHRSASASAVFAARIASSTPSSRDSIWNGKPAPSTYLHKLLDVTRRLPLLDSLSVRCLSSYLFFRPYFGGNYAYASQGRVGVPRCAPFLLPLPEIGKRTSGYFGGDCEIELPWVGISLARCRSPISVCPVVGHWSHSCWAGL